MTKSGIVPVNLMNGPMTLWLPPGPSLGLQNLYSASVRLPTLHFTRKLKSPNYL